MSNISVGLHCGAALPIAIYLMNLLIINSSPRRNGIISNLLAHAASIARSNGVDCTIINLYDKNLRYCKGCMSCRTELKCPIADDMTQITDAIRNADRIVIGAPCYWGNMPGILKTMFDRSVYLFIANDKGMVPKPLLKNKKALVISTATTPMPWSRLFGQTSGTVKSISKILKMGGIKVIPSLQIGDTANHNITERDLSTLDKKLSRLMK